MYKEVLRAIANIEIFPVISLGIFFLFFVVMLVRVIRTEKKVEQQLAAIPLQDGTDTMDKYIDNPFQDL